jgi:hypothetical protein
VRIVAGGASDRFIHRAALGFRHTVHEIHKARRGVTTNATGAPFTGWAAGGNGAPLT